MSSITIPQKVKAFEYLSKIFFSWYCDLNADSQESINNNFSKLKLIKLHFFACAVTSNEAEGDLLCEFDNFYAMPLGHVESDIYSAMSDMKMIEFHKTSIDVKEVGNEYFDDLNEDLKQRLELAVKLLREKNPELINYEPMKLVELSHTWNSWTSVFAMARRLDKYSMKIPAELIRTEYKNYSLN